MTETSLLQTWAKRLILQTLSKLSEGCLEIVCPEGNYSYGDAASPLRGLVVVHNQRFFTRALFGGDVGMGESYMDGDWSSPDLASVIRIAVKNLSRLPVNSALLSILARIGNRYRHWRNDNSPTGSGKNISFHYDLGNDFYKLFLDENMAYSCARYLSADDSLDKAQINKFEAICRKLNLSDQDHLLEIGTGWGGFAIYAAAHYGCRITTTTISRQQYEYSVEWISRLGLEDRIELLFEDYRRLQGQFDKIVSIEMFEAVGVKHYDEYFKTCDRLLRKNGVMLLQTININDRVFDAYRRSCDWIQKYIFPGAELASLSQICQSVARCTSLQLYHAEDIGMHYAATLRAWRGRFLNALEAVRTQGFDERFIRRWDYYFAYCEGAFTERHIGDFQIVLTKSLSPRPLMNEPWEETSAVKSMYS